MAYQWGAKPVNVACTKVASKLVRPAETEHSLKSLLERHLGIFIDQGQRLSDWSATHLTEAQISYAAADVAYLIDLLGVLTDEAGRAGRCHLLDACVAHIPTRVQLDILGDPDVFTS